LADVTTTDKGVKVTVEMPGINKQDIKVSACEDAVEVSTIEKARRKYHRIIDLPSETDIETARSTYSNGILEIIFDKKAPPKSKRHQSRLMRYIRAYHSLIFFRLLFPLLSSQTVYQECDKH
jgi:HSP20 family protein